MRSNLVCMAMVLVGSMFALCARAAEEGSEKSAAAKSPAGEWLRAGPIRVKLEDGELRYLYVGDKEIIRRIYFGVRGGTWATAMPKFSKIAVDKGDDHFTVSLAADCKMDAIDYSWSGTITGTADGKITFQATGTPNASFDSNRIGLCVLFGVHSLATTQFETDGKISHGEFPRLIAPGLVASQFHKLQYTTEEGMTVATSLEGAIFDMEDQRNWGDSSWKAYAPLPYAYKAVNKGDTKTETVTIAVSGTIDAKVSEQEPVHVKIGDVMKGARLPALTPAPAGKVMEFTTFSFGREKFADKKEIAWSYIPTTHLPDADVIMENLPTVAYQARTVKSVIPDCTMNIGPIGLSKAGSTDPRANTPLAAAWATAMVKFLAMGGVNDAGFAVGDGLPALALDAVRPYARQQLLATETVPPFSHHVLAYAAGNDKGVGLFLINPTTQPSQAQVEGLSAKQVKVLHVAAGATDQAADVADGALKIDLAPYEVVRVTIAK